VSRTRGTKSSAALIVAVVALIAALSGGAIAGVAVTSLNKKEKKQVSKISKKQGKKQAVKQIGKVAPLGKLTYVTAETTANGEPNQAVNPAVCPSGSKVIGGGIKMSNPGVFGGTVDTIIEDSYPTANGWAGHVIFDELDQTSTTIAICAKAPKVKGKSSLPGS
jgi:hypothetical protein